MYSAVTFARYDNQLQMYGFQSQNLYSGIPVMWKKKSDIESEIIHLKKWVNSGHTLSHLASTQLHSLNKRKSGIIRRNNEK